MRIIKKTENGIKIDLLLFFRFLLGKIWILALAALIGGTGSFFGMKTMVKPNYKATMSMYINNSTGELKTSYITSGDLSASAAIGNTYSSIIKSNQLLSQILEETGIRTSLDSLRGSIDVSSVNGSAVLTVSVTRKNPKEAAFIANTIGSLAPDLLTEIVEGSSVKVIDTALIPTRISSPNYRLAGIMGGAACALLCLLLIVIREASRTAISSEEELNEWEIPVIGVIDSFDQNKKRRKNAPVTVALTNDSTPFFIREAYNMARTNLMLSLAGRECKTILFTSSIKGEGKSITTINLARAMAAAGKKVIVLDCDFRMSTVAARLGVESAPGITNMLTGTSSYMVMHISENFDFIPSGSTPPNPSELLGSAEMKQLLEKLENSYDYIFIDSPPVGIVTDPLVLIPRVSGVVVVVRENVAQKPVLARTLHALDMANAKVIGFCYNGKQQSRRRFGKYYGYGGYEYGYGYGYEAGKEKRKAGEGKKSLPFTARRNKDQ